MGYKKASPSSIFKREGGKNDAEKEFERKPIISNQNPQRKETKKKKKYGMAGVVSINPHDHRIDKPQSPPPQSPKINIKKGSYQMILPTSLHQIHIKETCIKMKQPPEVVG